MLLLLLVVFELNYNFENIHADQFQPYSWTDNIHYNNTITDKLALVVTITATKQCAWINSGKFTLVLFLG